MLMRLLLDTHVLLWWLNGDAKLDTTARQAISAPRNLVYVSAVSLWEIVIKRKLGKLELPDTWSTELEKEAFRRLFVTWEHALRVASLPAIHQDPFDRLLIAQAAVEGLVLITHDQNIARYDIETLRA